jgi:hypothetical protein
MCGSCEPLGLCRTPACDLRGVSPLPLATSNPDVVTAVPPPGRWGQPGAREGFSDHLRERWQEPGRKEAQAERSRARWAALSEDERAELTQKMVGAQGRFRQQAPEIAGGGRHGET